MDINEKALLYRAQTGDRAAAETLYERYYLDIFTYLFYRVSDKTTAEKFSAEVFVRMIRRLPQFTNNKITFLAWLYEIARDLVEEKQSTCQPELITPEMMTPEHNSEDHSANRSFKLAIRQLNDQEKSIIVHRFVEGKSVKDLVKITKSSERAIQSLQHQALKSLQTALAKVTAL